MSKQLEKALKDAIKEKKYVLGTKQVLGALKNSKLIVLSKSTIKNTDEKIQKSAKKENIATVHFNDSSVALGRLCGLQFRVSAVSLTSITDANVKSILNEAKTK